MRVTSKWTDKEVCLRCQSGNSCSRTENRHPEVKLRNHRPRDRSNHIRYFRYSGKLGARSIPEGKRIVLDLTGVKYIDSSGMGTLVSIYMHARRANCDLEIANPKQRMRDLFRLSRLDSVFKGHDDLLGMTPD